MTDEVKLAIAVAIVLLFGAVCGAVIVVSASHLRRGDGG